MEEESLKVGDVVRLTIPTGVVDAVIAKIHPDGTVEMDIPRMKHLTADERAALEGARIEFHVRPPLTTEGEG